MPVKSKGVVLFAFNTDAVDYVQIADQAARLVHHTLNLPVTLITDKEITTQYIDQTIVVENTVENVRVGYASGSQWRNGNRYQAYELSPYDETILIDSDYLMLDDSLLKILDTTSDYRIVYHNQNPKQKMTGDMGQLSLDYVWATAITFKRTSKTESMFQLVGRIQRNYAYYRRLYNVRETNFRNDYAFAIANNIVSGYSPSQDQSIPWSMLTFDQPVTNIEFRNNMLVVRGETAHVVSQQNIHVMDKDFLLSANYIKFVDTICQK